MKFLELLKEMMIRFIESAIKKYGGGTYDDLLKVVYSLGAMVAFQTAIILLIGFHMNTSLNDYDNLKKDYLELSTVYTQSGDIFYDMNIRLGRLEQYSNELHKDNQFLVSEVIRLSKENEALKHAK